MNRGTYEILMRAAQAANRKRVAEERSRKSRVAKTRKMNGAVILWNRDKKWWGRQPMTPNLWRD